MKDNYYVIAKPQIERQGGAEDLAIAEQYLLAKEEMDKKKDAFQLEKNRVLNLCKSGNKIILGGKGMIEVKEIKGGSLKINVKI